MRLFVFNFFLLASVAIASPNERPKRHLSYLKNLISTAFNGRSQINIQEPPVIERESEYKLFKLPGYDDIMVKVTPRKPVVEQFVYPAVEPVNINAFASIVGTKNKDDALLAVQNVDNLLSSGILYGGQNNLIKENVVPMFPSLNTGRYVVQEKVKTAAVNEKRPVQGVVKPVEEKVKVKVPAAPMLPASQKVNYVTKEKTRTTSIIQTKPVLTGLAKPVEEKVEIKVPPAPILPAPKKVNNVSEEKIKAAPVTKRKPVITEAIKPLQEKVEVKAPFEPIYSYKQIQNYEPVTTYAAYSNPGVELVENIKMKSDLPMCIKQRVDEAIVLGANPTQLAPVQAIFQYPTPPVVDFSYPIIEANSFLREGLFTEGFEPFADYGLSPQRFRPSKDGAVRYKVRPTKIQAINPHPISLHTQKSPQTVKISASKDKVNPPTRKVQAFTNLGDKVNLSQTLGPVPPQYIIHRNKGGISAVSDGKIVKPTKVVPIVGSKDNVSNAKIPSDVYKFQPNPNTGKVVTENGGLKNNGKNTVATTVTSDAHKKDTTVEKHVVFTNKGTVTLPSVASPVVNVTNAPKITSLKDYIEAVIPEHVHYSYQQRNADGTTTNIKGYKHGVPSDAKENNSKGRGDIPDQ